jgi:hypothetical protein
LRWRNDQLMLKDAPALQSFFRSLFLSPIFLQMRSTHIGLLYDDVRSQYAGRTKEEEGRGDGGSPFHNDGVYQFKRRREKKIPWLFC